MVHIKIYQKIDPRFKQQQKLIRETRVIRSEMESLLESWHSYTSSPVLNEGLQDTILAKLREMVNTFKTKMTNAVSQLDFILDFKSVSGFENIGSQLEKVNNSIVSAKVDQTISESEDYFNSKPLKKLLEDRQKFDKLLRQEEGKKPLKEALTVLAAFATGNHALAILAAIPFFLITSGKICKFFGLKTVGGVLVAAGEVIERIEKTIEESIALPIAFPLVKIIIKKAQAGSKFAKFLLPSDSSEYWSNPKVAELEKNEFLGTFVDRLKKGISSDVEHAMGKTHSEQLDLNILETLAKQNDKELRQFLTPISGLKFDRAKLLKVSEILDFIIKKGNPEKTLAKAINLQGYKKIKIEKSVSGGTDRGKYIESLRKKIIAIVQVLALAFIAYKSADKLKELLDAAVEKVSSSIKTGASSVAQNAQNAEEATSFMQRVVHALEAPAEVVHAAETAEKVGSAIGSTAVKTIKQTGKT